MTNNQHHPTPHDLDDDDRPVGRVLKRREVLALFGGIGAAVLIGCSSSDDGTATATSEASGTTEATSEATSTATSVGDTSTAAATATSEATSEATSGATTVAVPACVVIPERTEGPYFVDGQIERSDITEDREGVPLGLTVNVLQVGDAGCVPLEGAMVDVWHCDALGVYSGVNDVGFDTTGQQFLRGYQLTDANGVASFDTIYPGWYSGRTVHIHFKIRTQDVNGDTYEFTSQWFFDEAVSDAVFETDPYASKGQRDTLNATDGIYSADGNGAVLTLALTGDPSSGYAATFDIGLDLSDLEVGASDSASNDDGRPGR